MWIWKTEIIETPKEDVDEFTRRVHLVVEHFVSLKKDFTIDKILRELWERNLNLRDLRVENKREMIIEVASDKMNYNEDYTITLNHRTNEYEWYYCAPIVEDVQKKSTSVLRPKKFKSIKKLMGLKGCLK